MVFTVIRPGGATDVKFRDYARVLRRRGADIGKLPRVPDPIAHKRWLPAWHTRTEAQAFAAQLNKETHDGMWEVAEVSAPVSEGPLGPIEIQMVRQSDGLTFALHPLAQAVIRSAFPDAVSATTFATIGSEAWEDFRKVKGGLESLSREIVPNLTGLNLSQLADLGYSVVDADTRETLVTVPPAALTQT